ncbi:MAG: DUF6230 family protein [Phycicoccus sp.]
MLSTVSLRVYGSFVALTMLVLLVAVASRAVAVPLYLGQIGNFQIGASSVTGTDFDLGLAIDADSGERGGSLPVGELAFDSATIDDLVLEKQFDLSSVLGPGGGGDWKLAITADGATQASGLRLNAAGVCADRITFGPSFSINGKGAGTDDVSDDLSLGAPSISLTRPGIEATYLTTKAITLDKVRIDIRRGEYAYAPCAAAAGRG